MNSYIIHLANCFIPHNQIHFFTVDIFTGKTVESTVEGCADVEAPIVTRTEYALASANANMSLKNAEGVAHVVPYVLLY